MFMGIVSFMNEPILIPLSKPNAFKERIIEFAEIFSQKKPTRNQDRTMKKRMQLLIPLLAGSMLAAPVCKGTEVFSDSFTNVPGTLIVGKLPQVGSGTWTSGGGSGDGSLAVSSLNSLDTAGKSVAVFGGFTASLGVGQMLTVQCDTLAPASGSFLVNNTSWGGISLYTGHTTGGTGSEVMFFGNPSAGAWGTDGSIGRFFGTDTNEVNHATFTYVYDTGAWSLSTSSGYSVNGTGPAHYALNGLRVGCGTAYPNLDNLTVDISPVPVFSFVSQTPANNTYSAPVSGPISVQTTDGGSPVNTNTIVMKVDGSTVTPSIGKTNNVTTIDYLPATPLSAGSLHTVLVTLSEDGGTAHTNSWSFTTGYPSLPATLVGPFTVSNDVSTTIFTAAGEGWLGTNYQSTSSKTLYARFSMEFNSTNTTGGTPITFGGFEFYQGGTEKLLIGKQGGSANWSVGAGAPNADIPPITPIVTNDWHTFLVRVDYSPGVDAAVKVWLDPDFTQTEPAQPNAPLTFTMNNTFDNVRLRGGFSNTTTTYTNIVLAETPQGVGLPAPTAVTFRSFVPGQNASSAAVATPISINVLFGSYGVNTNTVSMTLDGNSVTPTFSGITANSFTVNYQPPSVFAPGSAHTVVVSLTDSNNTPYSTTWSFTADAYPTLPVSMAGPFDVTSGLDVTLWNAQNGWINGNYGANSTNTLYTQFSMVFYDFPQTTNSAGGSYGGLHFFQDNNERLLIGNAWLSTNWSADAKEAGEPDFTPIVPIVVGDWHTFVIKSVYSSNAPTAETVWMDPDFTKSLDSQSPSLTTALNNTFNQVRLRCGNGSTYAEFTNIVMAATAQDLGFPVPMMLSIHSGQLSWTGGGTLQSAPAVTGPWNDAVDQSNPQVLSTTNPAEFYRLRQ